MPSPIRATRPKSKLLGEIVVLVDAGSIVGGRDLADIGGGWSRILQYAQVQRALNFEVAFSGAFFFHFDIGPSMKLSLWS